MLGAALACTSALAAGKIGQAEAQARYQQERDVCRSGRSNQDRATCLREAGAALAEAKHDGLDDGPAPYVRNALQRCERLPDEDRRACVSRMQGQGTTSGSVAGGGIYRELVTREAIAPSTALPDGDGQIAPAR
jgi:hypothetical protein